MNTLKSVGAVLAGIVAGIILTLATDEILHLAGVFPPWGKPAGDNSLLLATAYRVVYGAVGSYIAARLAPDHPMAHALAVGFVGLVVSAVGAAVTWNRGAEFGPHWYPLALIVIALPCAWAGGKFREMQLR
jgi:hypothetical protein